MGLPKKIEKNNFKKNTKWPKLAPVYSFFFCRSFLFLSTLSHLFPLSRKRGRELGDKQLKKKKNGGTDASWFSVSFGGFV